MHKPIASELLSVCPTAQAPVTPAPEPTPTPVPVAVPAPQVSTALVGAMLDVMQQRGMAPQLLESVRAELHAEPTQTFLTHDDFRKLLGRAVELGGDPALGLHCGLQAGEASFGLISPLISHTSTLRQAIALVLQFRPLLVEDVQLELTERLGVAELRCTLSSGTASPANRSFTELMVAGLLRMLRRFGCSQTEIYAVRFEYGCPHYHAAYTDAFGDAARFSQRFTGIEFAASALDREHLHRQPDLHALVLAEAERRLERRTRPLSHSERVRTLLRGRLSGRLPDLQSAARTLGLSTRTLRRYLEVEGTSYREITQELLYESACSMLRNPELTLQCIAHKLGFSDSTTFHRAFKRWAQQSPTRYRQAVTRSLYPVQ